MTQEKIPENAIDRFFYKTNRAVKNTKKTIAESKVVNNTFVKPFKVLFSGGIWVVWLWYLLVGLIIFWGVQ